MIKSTINQLFRYFGWRAPFGMRSVKKTAVNTSLEQTKILINEWVSVALKTINLELRKQIEMNGFSAEKIRTGETILTREILVDHVDESIKHETYRVGNIEILRVTWKLNGFSLHVRPRQDSREIKKVIQKDNGKIIQGNFNSADPALVAKAAEMVKEFDKTPTPKITQ